jgi:hypothetical protein
VKVSAEAACRFLAARHLLPPARSRGGGRDARTYDGKGEAWVRFDDGTHAIVGGSRVER